ncbi:hypothetical protein [Planococcus rifietoensis]|uniref:hypothetical protein n=1 Tax=Planococcus rifietoensis TaxID=200991 RepID=UPI003850CC16
MRKKDFEHLKGRDKTIFLAGVKAGIEEGVSIGFNQGVKESISQLKKEASEQFKREGKNAGMNFFRNLKSKYPEI